MQKLPAFLLSTLLLTFGCRAQQPAPAGASLSPEQEHRVEVLLRQKANIPPGSTMNVGPRTPSEFPGYDSIAVSITTEGQTSHPKNFLLSTDGKTLMDVSKFSLDFNPRDIVSGDNRPARGGPATAPVLFVNFDDLECPYCARFHASIFPAITERYGQQVRIVYRDFPLDTIHPWAMRAAVDTNCLAAQSPAGYWDLVDGIHAHASDFGAPTAESKDEDHKLDRANAQLDKQTHEQGMVQKVDLAQLDACIKKQDTSAIEASKKFGNNLGIESTPTYFINGAKFDGAVPIDLIFNEIDKALRAQNITPPPPYVAPAAATPKPGK